MAFNIYKVVRVACLSRSQFVYVSRGGKKPHVRQATRTGDSGNAKSYSRQKPLFAGYLYVNFQKSPPSKTSHNFVALLETREVDLWQVQPIRNWQNQGGELAPVNPPHMSATHPLSYRDIIHPRQQQNRNIHGITRSRAPSPASSTTQASIEELESRN